jgi:hypothetical protein
MRRWLRNRILVVTAAGLLAFTVSTPPASAADLGMPTKAPVYKAPEAAPAEFDWWPLLFLLAFIPLGLCIGEVICGTSGPPPSQGTHGGTHHDALPI